MVLLKNESNVLPLKKGTKVAVIGEFAEKPRYQGAGSSVVNPTKLEDTFGCIGNYGIEIVDSAEKADVVLLFIGLHDIDETEGFDRVTMNLSQKQLQLIDKATAVSSKTVAIISAGSPIEMP